MPVLLYRTKLRHTEKATYFTKMVKFLFHWYRFVLETSYTVKRFCVAKSEAFSHRFFVALVAILSSLRKASLILSGFCVWTVQCR